MHVFVYFIAGFILVAGLSMASELEGTQAMLFGVQVLIAGILIATFGRIEQHLGMLVESARHTKGAAAERAGSPDDVLVLGSDHSIGLPAPAEQGRILGRDYRRFNDGSVEVHTLVGPKNFPSMDAAKTYLT